MNEDEKDVESKKIWKMDDVRDSLQKSAFQERRASNHLMKIPKIFLCLLNPKRVSSVAICNLYGLFLTLVAMMLRTGSSSIVHALTKIAAVQLIFVESVMALILLLLNEGYKILRERYRTYKISQWAQSDRKRQKDSFLVKKTRGKATEKEEDKSNCGSRSWLFKSYALKWQICKALCNVAGTLLLFEGLKRIPLLISSSLSLSSIFFSAFGGVIFLREKMTRGLFLSLFLALCGAFIFSRFCFDSLSLSWLYPIGAAFLFSLSTLISKRIALFDSLGTSLFWTFLLQIVFLLIPSLKQGLEGIHDLSILLWAGFLIGGITLGSLALSLQAETFAALPFLTPFKSIRVLFSALFGWIIFHEVPTFSELLGVGCLLVSTFFLFKNLHKSPSYYLQNQGQKIFSEKEK